MKIDISNKREAEYEINSYSLLYPTLTNPKPVSKQGKRE
jgi:hypothetical protein